MTPHEQTAKVLREEHTYLAKNLARARQVAAQVVDDTILPTDYLRGFEAAVEMVDFHATMAEEVAALTQRQEELASRKPST